MTKRNATRGKELSRESVHEAELSSFQKASLKPEPVLFSHFSPFHPFYCSPLSLSLHLIVYIH